MTTRWSLPLAALLAILSGLALQAGVLTLLGAVLALIETRFLASDSS